MKRFYYTICCLAVCSLQMVQAQVIHIDSKNRGRTFEGVGALSAGASSRLLIDYPEPQRSELLDFLFKPQFGASIHHLKVEIGGDVNSTCGTEPSHERHRGDEDYTRGFEWWLMREAKKRNPSIMLDALAWGIPYWPGQGNFYSKENALYLSKFVKGAKDVQGLDIDYIGCWNEFYSNAHWIKTLRAALDKLHLQTKIVAADEPDAWKIKDDLLKDKELFAVVDVVGNHYCQGYNGFLYNGKTPWQNFGADYRIIPPELLSCGKPIWSTEDGPWQGDWNGAKGIIKALVRNYIEAKMTKTIIWSLITSYYDILSLPNSGLMVANSPWSGHYEVSPALWAMAHVGQFVQPGWIYLEGNANGYTQAGGSYVSLMSPDQKDISIVMETIDARSGQNLILALDPRWQNKTFHLWKTDSLNYFIEEQTIQPVNGYLELPLSTKTIYTLTTTTGQHKGHVPAIPPQRNFPFPYEDDFNAYDPNRLPKYTNDQVGVFETYGHQILRQQITQKGVDWLGKYNEAPFTVLGDSTMTDYSISIDVLLTKAGQSVDLMGRIQKMLQWIVIRPRCYWLHIHSDGTYELCKVPAAITQGLRWNEETWPEIHQLFKEDQSRHFVKIPLEQINKTDMQKMNVDIQQLPDKKNSTVVFRRRNQTYSIHPKIVLAAGKTHFPLKKWNNVKLTFEGETISAYLNGKRVCTATDDTYVSGLAGFGCGWHTADFDNLKVTTASNVAK